jgi:hypothetical protein
MVTVPYRYSTFIESLQCVILSPIVKKCLLCYTGFDVKATFSLTKKRRQLPFCSGLTVKSKTLSQIIHRFNKSSNHVSCPQHISYLRNVFKFIMLCCPFLKNLKQKEGRQRQGSMNRRKKINAYSIREILPGTQLPSFAPANMCEALSSKG